MSATAAPPGGGGGGGGSVGGGDGAGGSGGSSYFGEFSDDLDPIFGSDVEGADDVEPDDRELEDAQRGLRGRFSGFNPFTIRYEGFSDRDEDGNPISNLTVDGNVVGTAVLGPDGLELDFNGEEDVLETQLRILEEEEEEEEDRGTEGDEEAES